MADAKITDLTELAEAPAASDVVAIVDIDAAPATTKKITATNLVNNNTNVLANTAHKDTVTGNPHALDTDDVTEGSTNKYAAPFGYLQYSHNAAQSTLIPLVLSFNTDQSSSANGLFTKSSATEFRVDFTGTVEFSYTLSGYPDANDRGFSLTVLKNGSPIAFTERIATGKNIATRSGEVSGTFVDNCVANDLYSVELDSLEAALITVDASMSSFYIKRIK